MKKIIAKLIYHIVQRILPFIKAVELDNQHKRLDSTLSKMKSYGSNVFIKEPYQISGENGIEIGDNFYSNRNLRLEAVFQYANIHFSPIIKIGNDVAISANCHIGAINRIEIGDGTLLGSNIYITDHFHGTIHQSELTKRPIDRHLFSKGPVVVGKNVWIGDGVCIMPNVTIGDNVVIGANSVVTKSFGSNLVIAGNPAKVIKDLNQ